MPALTHEAAAHVFGFLADFASAYPDLCEGDRKMYRDLARAAIMAIEEDLPSARALLIDGAIQDAIDTAFRRLTAARPDGKALLADLAARGVRVRLVGRALRVGPRDRVGPAVLERLRRVRESVIEALRSQEEML